MEETQAIKVLVTLGRLEEKTDAINEHLKDLNGSVQRLYQKSEDNRLLTESVNKDLWKHQVECPGLAEIHEINRKLDSGDFRGSNEVREVLGQVETAVAIEERAKGVSLEWKDKLLYPLVRLMAIGGAVLLLMHASDLLTVFFHVK